VRISTQYAAGDSVTDSTNGQIQFSHTASTSAAALTFFGATYYTFTQGDGGVNNALQVD